MSGSKNIGGKNIDQFHARQKSKDQKDANTGTTLSRNTSTDKDNVKH